MVSLDIELTSAGSSDDIYDLRNFLQQEIQGMDIHLKEQPTVEGQMSLGGDPMEIILTGIYHVAIALPLEELYHSVLKPKIKAWLESRKKTDGPQPLGIVVTAKDEKMNLVAEETSNGDSRIFKNLRYNIDVDKTKVILIGNGEFDSGFPSIPPVEGNLRDLAGLLGDKRHIGIPPENIFVAFNKSSTEIEELLLKNSKLKDTQTLIVYYTGHGYRSDKDKLFLVAKNSRKVDDDLLGGIDLDFIRHRIFKTTAAKQKILILDACHSGISTQSDELPLVPMDVEGTYFLASSPGDDVSYFDKSMPNTFFTGALLEVLTKGLDNSSEMLSLNDMYDYSKHYLQQKKSSQQPAFKNHMNIPPANFFIARNPQFSVDRWLRQIKQQYDAGKLTEASTEARNLLRRFPGNVEAMQLQQACTDDHEFMEEVRQGDEYFYQVKNYALAKRSYEKAYDIRKDMSVLNKIRKCETQAQAKMPEIYTTPKPAPGPLNGGGAVQPVPKPSIFSNRALMAAGAVVVLIALWFGLIRPHMKDRFDYSDIRALLQSNPDSAVALLTDRSSGDDSASYYLGSYYRESNHLSEANMWFEKAKGIPAAQSAIGEMYYKYNAANPSENDIAASHFRAANDDSHGTDTTALYFLGLLAGSKYDAQGQYGNALLKDSFVNEAERWYRKGANQHGIRSINALANLLYFTKRNYSDALYWVQLAADKGYVAQQTTLGYMYEMGLGMKAPNPQKAGELYRQAAAAGEPNAISNLGMGYLNGRYNLPKDANLGYSMLLDALRRSRTITTPYSGLGMYYEYAAPQNILNLDSAKYYYAKGAALGNDYCKAQCARLHQAY